MSLEVVVFFSSYLVSFFILDVFLSCLFHGNMFLLSNLLKYFFWYYSFERAFWFLIIFTKLSQRGFNPSFLFLSIWNSSSIEQFQNLNISSQKHFRIYLELSYSLKEALSSKWKYIILTRWSFPECWSIKIHILPPDLLFKNTIVARPTLKCFCFSTNNLTSRRGCYINRWFETFFPCLFKSCK